MFNTHTKRYIG